MNESRDGVLNLYFEAAADTCTNSRWSGATPKPSFAKVASALSCRIPFLRRIPRSLFPYRWTPSFDTRYGPLRYIFLCYSNSSHELSFFAYQFIVRCSWEFTLRRDTIFCWYFEKKNHSSLHTYTHRMLCIQFIKRNQIEINWIRLANLISENDRNDIKYFK